ncbi:hypothetical protein HMI55_004344 [Coelomomyces lativittatus]|nr:hypothetical protein HMI55_004344 [Coelomomyces lativittatus]
MRRFELQPIFLHLGPLQLKYPEHLGHALVHLFLNAKDRPIVLERVDLFARIPELFLCLQFLLRQYGGLIVCTSFEKPDSLPFQYTFQLAAPSLPPPNHSLHFKDVFGMEHVKLQLLKNRHTLLYGPPGTGKTMLATAFAAEYQGHFFPVRLSELISYFVGVTEKKLVELFKKAKDAGPSIIFLDELDTLCPTRESGTSSMGRKVVCFTFYCKKFF